MPDKDYENAGPAERQAYANGVADGRASMARIDASLATRLQQAMEENIRLESGLAAIASGIRNTGWIKAESIERIIAGCSVTIAGKTVKARKGQR